MLLLLVLLPVVSCQFQLESNSTEFSSKCAAALLKKYFVSGDSQKGGLLSILLGNIENDIENQFLQEVNSQSNQWSIHVKNLESKPNENYEIQYKVQCYFAFLDVNEEDGFDGLDEIHANWKSEGNWNPSAQFIVFLTQIEESEDEMDEVVTEILIFFSNLNIFNVNVIAQNDEDDEIFSKSMFPYDSSNNCGKRVISIELLDTCSLSEDNDIVVEEKVRGKFLDKFPNNLQSCPLKVYARVFEPYTFHNSSSGKFYDGIDFQLIQTLSDQLNFSAEFILQNKTLFEILQELMENDVELVVGGIDEDPNLAQYISATSPYFQDELTWCVRKVRFDYDWMSFVYSFQISTWILIGVVLFTVMTVLFVHEKSFLSGNASLLKIYFMIFGVLFNQNMGSISPVPSVRILIISYFLFALIISNTYQGFLFGKLTLPRSPHQISTVYELRDNRMKISGGVGIINHLNKDGQDYEYIRQNFDVCYNEEECVKRAAFDPELAVASSRLHIFYNPRIPRKRLFCFSREQNIHSFLSTILTSKNYHLLQKFNPIIQKLIESGHILHWAQSLDFHRKLQDIKKRKQEEKLYSLSLEQMKGPFIYILIFSAIACSVFIVEKWIGVRYGNTMGGTGTIFSYEEEIREEWNVRKSRLLYQY